jgi:hypothetical protein
MADPFCIKSKSQSRKLRQSGYRINEKEVFGASINFDNLTRKNPAAQWYDTSVS